MSDIKSLSLKDALEKEVKNLKQTVLSSLREIEKFQKDVLDEYVKIKKEFETYPSIFRYSFYRTPLVFFHFFFSRNTWFLTNTFYLCRKESNLKMSIQKEADELRKMIEVS